MRIPAMMILMAFAAALTGCASPRSFAPGASMVEILAKAGPPTDIRIDRNGDELWEYATGPQGTETYLVRSGIDGKVKAITQLLTEERMETIVPGKMTKADVRQILGKPSDVSYTPAGTVWSWRFRRDGIQPGYLTVRFNPDNTVFERIAIIDFTGGRGREN